MEKGNDIVWLGLESNPDMMNEFAKKLGLDTTQYCFGDIFGLSEDLLCMIPDPLLAIILLFPGKAKVKFDEAKTGVDSNSFFLSQIEALDDACGTIAMIHAIANNLDKISLAEGPLSRYINENQSKSPLERGASLASNKDINLIHNSFVENEELNQTKKVEAGATGYHFVCFMQRGDEVVEFDGCKPSLTHHAKLTEGETFLTKTANIIQTLYLDPNPDILDFVMISFAQSQ
jgi:ubiquitin carboxyl-terminal hydrolase L3